MGKRVDEGLEELRGRAEAAFDAGADDAAALLRRLTELQPDDAAVWRDLGLALVNDGDLLSADRALRESLRLGGADPTTRVALAHVVFAKGDVDEAVTVLTEAATQSDDVAPLRSLVEMCRVAGRPRAALDAAEKLAAQQPDDVLTMIDLADLYLDLGEYDAALDAFRRLRDLDAEPGDAVYAYHGMIEVEIRRDRWRRALDLAISASALDRHQLTTDVLAFVTAQLFGDADRPAPPREEIERRMVERRAQHRQAHVEALQP